MPDIAVIGAGVFGAWSALKLADAGHPVTLVDAYGPANGRASSADHSRVIRAGYGPDAIYSRWATEARRDWTWLSGQTSRPLITTTGALFLGEPDNEYIADTRRTLSSLGLPFTWYEPGELAGRYRQISTDGLGPALLEHDAGVLRAGEAVQALVDIATSRFGVKYRNARVLPLDETRSPVDVRLSDGGRLEADVYVLACGPWLPSLLPIAIGARIRPTRQEVLYFGVPSGDGRFSVAAMPVWIDFSAGLYGIPDLDARGFKIGLDRHGPPIDPDTVDRVVSMDVVEATRTSIARRFPDLAAAPLVDSRVCQYENTSSGDFIIDRHPAWATVWLVGGGSGHGFKHGPAVGRYVADLVSGHGEPEPRFALATKTETAARAVY